jgi:hypothetical protein
MARVKIMFGREKSLIGEEGSLTYIAMLKIGKKSMLSVVTVRQF